MCGKVFEEGGPKFLVFGGGSSGFQVHLACLLFVIIAEAHVPRHHGVAADLFGDATVHAELHVAVEDGVVVAPRSIGLLRRAHHGVELVVALVTPRLIEEDGGDYLLSRTGQELQIRFQRLKMGIAPPLYPAVACHGIRLLPKVHMESLFLWCWQGATKHFDRQVELAHDVLCSRVKQFEPQLVHTGLCGAGHFESTPYGLRLSGSDAMCGSVGEQVGHLIRREVRGVVAAILEVVSRDVVQEVRRTLCGRHFAASVLPVGEAQPERA